GEVFVLISADEQQEQYVRITEVTVERQTFTILFSGSFRDFEFQTLQLSIASQLNSDFAGSDPHPTGRQAGAAKITNAQVADAARYFGAKKLAVSAAPGDLTVQLDSVYNNLVPSTQSEVALTDRFGGPGRIPVVPASTSNISVSYNSGVSL